MLWQRFITKTDGPLVHKWDQYFPVYERHFARFINTDVIFWEIGCGEGGSLEMWRAYLGPHARIVGIDIRPGCRAFETRGTSICIGHQADAAFLRGVLDEHGPPDVVLDDGSHVQSDITASFEFLYPRMARSGVYAVEDLHIAYWKKYGGGRGEPGSFIERSKVLVDELNAINGKTGMRETPFTRSTLSIHFYPGITVFERGRALTPVSVKRGQPAR